MESVQGSESDHGNTIIKNCNSRKRKELEDNNKNTQLSSAAIKRSVLKRQHDLLSSSNKDFKTLDNNKNTQLSSAAIKRSVLKK